MKTTSTTILNITTFIIFSIMMVITFQANIFYVVGNNGAFFIINIFTCLCILSQLVNYIYEASSFKYTDIENSIFLKVLFYKFCIYFTNFIIEGSLVLLLKTLLIHNYDVLFTILFVIIAIFHIVKACIDHSSNNYTSLFSIGESFHNHINNIIDIEKSKTFYKLKIQQYKNSTW